ncbi:MAG: ureidoglycolate lyase [Synechococcaceae cyanobacterium]|nr:ureidoglycolate lyase [Synechococcaceae cyanobacterium]
MQCLAATVLRAEPVAAALFAPFGQLITPVDDGVPWGAGDAHLVFDGAPIRFYLMRLRRRPSTLIRLTRHLRCSQCLGSADARPWLLAVAAPTSAASTLAEAADRPPIAAAAVRLFRIEPQMAVKLHPGTWHGGPLIREDEATFFNLELADTNLSDHEDRLLAQPLQLDLEQELPWAG